MPPPEVATPPGIAVVFDHGGQTQTTAPKATEHADISEPAVQAAAPPPPPPESAEHAAVNLEYPPDVPPPPPAPAPSSSTQPQPRPSPSTAQSERRRHGTAHASHPHYLVLNSMSYGSGETGSDAAPPTPRLSPHALSGMTFSPATAADDPMATTFTVKGHIGADWMAAFSQWVEDHKYYPQAALAQDQQGSVRIEIVVDRGGNVLSARLLDSAGSPFLDQAWLGLFRGVVLPPFPAGTKDDSITIDATMHFQLLQ